MCVGPAAWPATVARPDRLSTGSNTSPCARLLPQLLLGTKPQCDSLTGLPSSVTEYIAFP
jgi:hypothetical protein